MGLRKHGGELVGSDIVGCGTAGGHCEVAERSGCGHGDGEASSCVFHEIGVVVGLDREGRCWFGG